MPNIVKPSGINLLWAAGGTKTDPGQAKTNIGWVVELPPYQYQNWLDNRQDTFIAHINQHGIAEWDSETEYQGNLSYTQGSDGLIYKCIQTNTNRNPTNPVNNIYWSRAFEAYGSVAVVQAALNAHIANYQTLSGLTNLAAARSNLDVFSKAESDNRFAALLGNAANQFRVANATLSNHAVPLGQLNSLLVAASEVAAGVIQIASTSEVETGVNNTKAITPAKAQAVYLKKSQNLNDLPNKATARSNLGLEDTATLPSSTFLQAANNLSDLTNVTVARTNLGLGTAATAATGDFLRTNQNFADVANKPLARTNLGLADSATQPASSFLRTANNLSDLTNVATARSNLGLGTAALSATGDFLRTVNNLSDLPSPAAARSNLGLADMATTSSANVMFKTQNLAGLTNLAAARSNLGLADSATLPSSTWMRGVNNLSEITNAQTARNNLGLGGAATLNYFGTGVSSLDFTNVKGVYGYTYLPNGMLMQWGQGPALNDDQGTTVGLHIPMNIMSVQITGLGVASEGVGPCFLTANWGTTTFTVHNNYNSGPSRAFTWFAIGYV